MNKEEKKSHLAFTVPARYLSVETPKVASSTVTSNVGNTENPQTRNAEYTIACILRLLIETRLPYLNTFCITCRRFRNIH